MVRLSLVRIPGKIIWLNLWLWSVSRALPASLLFDCLFPQVFSRLTASSLFFHNSAHCPSGIFVQPHLFRFVLHCPLDVSVTAFQCLSFQYQCPSPPAPLCPLPPLTFLPGQFTLPLCCTLLSLTQKIPNFVWFALFICALNTRQISCASCRYVGKNLTLGMRKPKCTDCVSVTLKNN